MGPVSTLFWKVKKVSPDFVFVKAVYHSGLISSAVVPLSVEFYTHAILSLEVGKK